MSIFYCLAFFVGILFYIYGLNDPKQYSLLIVSAVLCGYYYRNRHTGFVLLAWLLGMAIAWQADYQYHRWELPSVLEGKPLNVTGMIVSQPIHETQGLSFNFRLNTCEFQQSPMICQRATIHLNIAKTYPLIVGDHWQFTVKLKRIHGLKNMGGFDFERYALSENIQATGNVVLNSHIQRLNQRNFSPLKQFRQYLTNAIRLVLPQHIASHWLLALITGIRDNIPPEQWTILRKTGTNHLMAIAGLHVGIIVALVYRLCLTLLRTRPKRLHYLPAQQIGLLMAWIAACFYASLAGWSLPTQRALAMLSILLVVKFSRIQTTRWLILLYALVVVLIVNPFSVLTDSFWLSFLTIALIIYGMSARLNPEGVWWHWGRVQWVVGIGLLPVSLYLFQEASLISFLANMLVIPLVSFLVLPLTFLSSFTILVSNKLTQILLLVADGFMTIVWTILSTMAHWPLATWQWVIPSPMYLLLFIIGVLLLLLPKGCAGKWCGITLLLPSFFWQPMAIQPGDIKLTVFDVGQGLAVLIQTSHHQLLYDAGPRLSANSDMGERVVLPALYANGVHQLDKLVISHGDNDHIGGAKAVLEHMKVLIVETSVPNRFAHHKVSYCLAGQTWHWDNVQFSYLHPTPAMLGLGNDSSCVLKVDNGHAQILLPGDIEKKAERRLLSVAKHQLASTLLIAPHHGSKTSIARGFIEAVKPDAVVFATGYRNRYHLPNKAVVMRYQMIGSDLYDTAKDGAITFTIRQTGVPMVKTQRPH